MSNCCQKIATGRLSSQFKITHRLERVLASRTKLLKKVTIMPKDHSSEVTGSIRSIPISEAYRNS